MRELRGRRVIRESIDLLNLLNLLLGLTCLLGLLLISLELVGLLLALLLASGIITAHIGGHVLKSGHVHTLHATELAEVKTASATHIAHAAHTRHATAHSLKGVHVEAGHVVLGSLILLILIDPLQDKKGKVSTC